MRQRKQLPVHGRRYFARFLHEVNTPREFIKNYVCGTTVVSRLQHGHLQKTPLSCHMRENSSKSRRISRSFVPNIDKGNRSGRSTDKAGERQSSSSFDSETEIFQDGNRSNEENQERGSL